MGETPFHLAFGAEAVIPVEIGELTWRTSHPNNREVNEQVVREDLDLMDEVRDQAAL